MSDFNILECPSRSKLLDQQTDLKSKECNLCHYSEKLRRSFKFPVASRGTGRILVVGDWVLKEEHGGSALGGAFATVFEEYLSKYTNLSSVDCTFTYAVKCNDGEEVKPKTPEYRNCARYLQQEIKLTDPLIILFVGKNASRSLIENKVRIKNNVGIPFQHFIMGKRRWCYYITNPVIAKSSTGAGPVIEAQFRGLAKFLKDNTAVYDEIEEPKIEEHEERKYVLIDTQESLIDMYEDLKSCKYIGMDTETNSLYTWSSDFKLVGISLAGDHNLGYYIPVGHNSKHARQLNWDKVVKPVIEKLVSDPSIQTIWHNLYYDYSAMKQSGLDIFKLDPDNDIWTHDSMLMTYLCNENPSIGLKEQMYIHFNIAPKKFKGVLQNADVNTFDDVMPEDALQYAADDAINCLMLFKKVAPKVKQESDNYTESKLLRDIYPTELNTIKVLADAHLKGIKVDRNYVLHLLKAVNEDIHEVKTKIMSICNIVDNVKSNVKVMGLIDWILEEDVKKSFIKKYKSKQGKLDVQKKTLELLISFYNNEYGEASKYNKRPPGKWQPKQFKEYLNLVLEYRHLIKVKSTYLDPIIDLMHRQGDDYFIHANIKSIGTTSGRMSSQNPNLQNIPRSTPKAPDCCSQCDNTELTADDTLSRYTCTQCNYIEKIYTYDLRRIYVPRSGYKFIAADYVGMELYLAAAVSGCQALYDVFLTKETDPDDPNGDMHIVTASSILKITPDEWQERYDNGEDEKMKHYRQLAKTVNYLALYGGSPEGLQATLLSQGLEFEIEECQDFLDAFFERFPEIKSWFSEMKYEISSKGRLVNNYGRIRHVLHKGGEVLSAINMLIQGLGAQIIKESLVNMYYDWEDRGKDYTTLLVIHDENVIEVPEDALLDATKSIRDHMETTVKDRLDVKLLTDPIPGMESLSKADKGISLEELSINS